MSFNSYNYFEETYHKSGTNSQNQGNISQTKTGTKATDEARKEKKKK